ncbi:MAG: hypothetical protein H6978_10130 [Gammaproteobacteria bacterium]|nr:hypothetical protein [Gammaproteobacteria bacterium]
MRSNWHKGVGIALAGAAIAFNPATLTAAVAATSTDRAHVALDAQGHPALVGVWTPVIHEDQYQRGPGPAQGEYWGLPINDKARAIADRWDPASQLENENQCLSHTSIYMMRSPFKFEIVKSDNMTVLATESFESIRVFYTDGRKHHPKGAAHTRMGNSIGRYNGDMLVVETDHMEEGYIERNGVLHSPDAVLTEYWTTQSGSFGDLITIVQVVEDPEYLTEPLVRSVTFQKVPDAHLEPYPCVVLDLY